MSNIDQNLSKDTKDYSQDIHKSNSPYCMSIPEERKAIEASEHESLTNKDLQTIENQIHEFLMTNNIKLNDSVTDHEEMIKEYSIQFIKILLIM